ncbi:hypothetical protein QOZ80_3BG0266950 [Eleusine coracana subsp. coracana]|nr:hypothetical protein QOZ80_3BG0266950 [Eleusine coracana subsp. coracana]
MHDTRSNYHQFTSAVLATTSEPLCLFLLMEHVEMRRNGAHRRPIRGAVAPSSGPPPPLKVYFVEPRDFRDLVQRLTGARTAAGPAPAPPMGAGQRMTLTPAAAVSQGNGQAAGDFDYSPWFSAPMFSPAYAPAGFHGHHHGGNQGR